MNFDFFFNFAKQQNYSKIPGAPVSYWLSAQVYEMYKNNQTIGCLILFFVNCFIIYFAWYLYGA